MKDGFRKQFRQSLSNENITYYGNVKVGSPGDISMDDLRSLGFQAIFVSVGAQGTKWLGLPGEDLEGVYHAKDLVYAYNKLPPLSQKKFRLGRRAAIIGAGNVMLDIAYYLIHEIKAEEAIALVRRGPTEVNFTKEEMTLPVPNLTIPAFFAQPPSLPPPL